MCIFKFDKSGKGEKQDTLFNQYPGISKVKIDTPYTPDSISVLGPDEIFVFGSNLAGNHAGGAAKLALHKFGAKWGQGAGLQGNSYAIPTMQGGVETIKPYVDDFISFAKNNLELTFYVTKIGCGIAGFKESDIAPLFKEALQIDNIRLPLSFIGIIKKHYLAPQPSKEKLVHAHGVSRTLADLVIVQNKKEPFTSPEVVMKFLEQFFYRLKKYGDETAFMAVRSVWNVLNTEDLFERGVLNSDLLHERIFNFERISSEYGKAYELYCKEKLYNLIVFLNQFRRYTNPQQILQDLHHSEIENFSHCTENKDDYIMSPVRAGGGYPIYYFQEFVEINWQKIAPEGRLDSKRLDEYMFKKHERGIRKYGLKAVIQHDYIQDACHSEVYFPKNIATGPVYIKNSDGSFSRSCGEGKGPNRIPYFLETEIAWNIISADPQYEYIDYKLIPKHDISLPILDRFEGILEFESFDKKKKFINELRGSTFRREVRSC